MGILNVTPDSFSDGSELGISHTSTFELDLDKVLRRAEFMVQEGAAFLDVGGESTRPGAGEVEVAEELDRVIPVIDALRENFDTCISIDTSAPEVMEEAIKHGVHLVNDIRAMTRNGAIDAVAASDVAVCLMHMQGQPRTMQEEYFYDDVVAEVLQFLDERSSACSAAGIGKERILIDPGFGFGKSVSHNFKLLRHLDRFSSLQLPVLIGVSRKSMLGEITGRDVKERVAASVSATTLALQGGANIVRAHDVAATMDAIRVHCAYKNET